MGKTFEDVFMEIQTEMVQIGLDLEEKSPKDAERLYILGCFGTSFMSLSTDVFFKVGNRIVHNGQMGLAEKYNGSLDVLEVFFEHEEEQMLALKKLCEKHNRPIPYEIRLVYDLVTGEFEAEYGYEPIPEGITSDDLHDAWMKDEQAKYPFDSSVQYQPAVVEQNAIRKPSQPEFVIPKVVPHNGFPRPVSNGPNPAGTESNKNGMFTKSPEMKKRFTQIDEQIAEKNRELAKLVKPKGSGFKFPFFWKK